jgi:hypothetical protein
MASNEARSGAAVVFLGPTLSPAEARDVLDAVYLPPAAQGSIVRAVQRFDPVAILIIDGSFQGEPAVRHKEILWALSRGTPVIGAASMGALRAAELFPDMRGVGLIYRWYRRFAFAPDDAVAVLYGPPEVNSAALTLALVDLLMTFRAAERRGLISHDFRQRLDAAARRLNFRERTMERIVAEAMPRDRPAQEWAKVLGAALVEQKKRDALDALRLMKEGAFPLPRRVPFTMTAAFARDLKHAGISI